MKDLTIHIDSRDAKKTRIAIVSLTFTDEIVYEGTNAHSQVILPVVEELLIKHAVKTSDITNILVDVDHGSFTGRRVGAVIAVMLGSLLQIPVNGKPADSLLQIPYEEDKWK